MLNTYRTFTDEKEVFYLSQYDEEDREYYCEAERWEDSFWFEEEFIKKDSKPATLSEILKYKITKWLNEKS